MDNINDINSYNSITMSPSIPKEKIEEIISVFNLNNECLIGNSFMIMKKGTFNLLKRIEKTLLINMNSTYDADIMIDIDKIKNLPIPKKLLGQLIKEHQERKESLLKRSEEKKEKETQEKIDDLKNKFRDVLEQYKSKTEHKNDILEKHIKQLNEDYEKRETEIEEILKNVEIVGNRNLGEEENKNNGFNQGFNELLDHIKTTLSEKTIIIKRLKASLAVSAKAFNDTIRVYEAKLIEFGLPPEELGFQLLETNTSKMPAGLVSD